jgi:NADH-quinone oxidoreductase subunit G
MSVDNLSNFPATKVDANPNLVNVEIDNQKFSLDKNLTIIQACEKIGIDIPRFCYHEKLKIAGNCRMCLVEVKPGPPKPTASCTMQLSEGMQVFTASEMVKKARQGVLELMLKNHPLDCPICDQGGECDLQDQAMIYGRDRSRVNPSDCKRAVPNKNIGPMIKTEMNRCIHCMRCVRFLEDIAGNDSLGASGRGENVEIRTFLDNNIDSEISGNIIDLCPVGALTDQTSAFKYRSWSAKKIRTIDLMDGVGSNIVCYVENNNVVKVIPYVNKWINQEWISDKARFSYDGLSNQRIDNYYYKENGNLVKTSQDVVIEAVKDKIKKSSPNEVMICVGPLINMETAFAINNFAKSIKVDKICYFKDNLNLNISEEGNYSFNTKFSDINRATSCLLIGSNPRFEAPNVNIRIRELSLSGVQISSIGFKNDFNYDINFIDDNLSILTEILEGGHNYCELLEKSDRPMIIVGESILNNENGKIIHDLILKICYKYNIIRDDWNGFNLLPKDPNFCGHLKLINAQKIEICNEYDVIQYLSNKKIKLLISFGFGGDEISKFLQNNNYKDLNVVYIGSNSDSLINFANIVIPAISYSENSGLYMNIEGRVQETRKLTFPISDIIESEIDTLNKIKKDDFDCLKGFDLIKNELIERISESDFNFKLSISEENSLFDIANNKRDINHLDSCNVSVSNSNYLLSNSVSKNSVNIANYRKSFVK